ncbi:arsenate reductase/protein-tyrosine-phosphatase family protein [Microbacterium sp. Ag1]|uniref:arsenate reductase/protein-tyrosine-phosphatase family protein n=1 Tax=Microbacterium sp. Ag1 TaxID=1643443 RepID=UPI00069CAB3A|nr:hypothetical protein [Microbacterium sp. Ag1]
MNPYDWMMLMREEGRNPHPPADLPGLFADRHRTGISLDVLAAILSVSWAKGAGPDGWPLRELPRDEWVRLFREVGYLYGGACSPEAIPTETLTLYRGAVPEYSRGLSWTTAPNDARFFGARYDRDRARLYVVDAEPGWMLGRVPAGPFSPGGEYIVDVPEGAERLHTPPVVGRPWRVLFVCVGNICRSPLAELVLRDMAAEHGLNVEAASVGVSAMHGDPMDPGTLATAERHGLDGSAHFARRLTMDDRNADCVVPLDPFAAGIVRLVFKGTDALVMPRPVPNPWRRSDDVQEDAYRLIVDVCGEVCAEARAALTSEAA